MIAHKVDSPLNADIKAYRVDSQLLADTVVYLSENAFEGPSIYFVDSPLCKRTLKCMSRRAGWRQQV